MARSHLLPRIHVLGMANLVPPAEVPTWQIPRYIGQSLFIATQQYIKVTDSQQVILWGIALTCHAAGHNFAGLAAARFFLGVFEACIQPVTMVMFSIWYTRMEQPLRLGIWIGCAGLGYVVAGITSFGIGHIHGDLSSWRYTFLIWGCITIAWGVVVLLFLPDSPATAKFLSEDEKIGVIERVKANGTGLEGKTFKMSQMWETLTDTKTWLLFIFAVSSNAPN